MVLYFRYLVKSTFEIFRKIKCIFSLAKFEYKLLVKDMFLGGFWRILSPFIQIGTYWLVFGIGIRQRRDIDGFEYVVWLTSGITAWFIINKGINVGANSIYSKSTLITRSNLSPFIITISDILSVVMDEMWTIVLMFIIYFSYGYKPHLYMFNLIYYILYIFFFVTSLSFITSCLVMLARDFRQVITMIMRLMFFLSPIMWQPGNNMPYLYRMFDKYNPIAYVINGFRDSMIYQKSFYDDVNSLAFFGSLCIVLYLVGIACQKKLRNNILDYL